MAMNKYLLAVIVAAAGVTALPAGAAQRGDPVKGAQVAKTVCAACHGETGSTNNPQFPKLAGQYPDYMVQAMRAYQTGARNNAVMKGIVAGLSLADMENVAAYYARQPSDLYTPSVLSR
jgi:Cytochrome c553